MQALKDEKRMARANAKMALGYLGDTREENR